MKDFPPPYEWKVSVRTCEKHPNGYRGHCERNEEKKTFSILIEKDNWERMVDDLWHEWAHIVDPTHGEKFHQRYGQIYRFYIEGSN